jgi:hypothetical protein
MKDVGLVLMIVSGLVLVVRLAVLQRVAPPSMAGSPDAE